MSDTPSALHRLSPDEALRPGATDARVLLTLWFAHKSFYWLLFSGTAVAYVLHRADQVDVSWTDPDRLVAAVFSPLVGLVLAGAVRIVTNLAALAVTWPLVREYEAPLPPREGPLAPVTTWLDRRQIAKALRSLRWTHHVRRCVLNRLGRRRAAVARLDPIIDVMNVVSFVGLVVAVAVAGSG